jgi:hypothetical protein
VAIGYDQWRNSYFFRMYGVEFYDKVIGKGLQDYDDIGHEVFTLGPRPGQGGGGRPPKIHRTPSDSRGRSARVGPSTGTPVVQNRWFGLKHKTFDVVSHPPPTGWTILDDMTELNRKLCYAHQLVGKMTSYQIWLADEDELTGSLYCHIHLSIPPGNYGRRRGRAPCGLRLQLPVQVRRAETGHGERGGLVQATEWNPI